METHQLRIADAGGQSLAQGPKSSHCGRQLRQAQQSNPSGGLLSAWLGLDELTRIGINAIAMLGMLVVRCNFCFELLRHMPNARRLSMCGLDCFFLGDHAAALEHRYSMHVHDVAAIGLVERHDFHLGDF